MSIFEKTKKPKKSAKISAIFWKKIFRAKKILKLDKKWSHLDQKYRAPNFFFGYFDPPFVRHFCKKSKNWHFSKKKVKITELSKNHLCRFCHLIWKKNKKTRFLKTPQVLGGFLTKWQKVVQVENQLFKKEAPLLWVKKALKFWLLKKTQKIENRPNKGANPTIFLKSRKKTRFFGFFEKTRNHTEWAIFFDQVFSAFVFTLRRIFFDFFWKFLVNFLKFFWHFFCQNFRFFSHFLGHNKRIKIHKISLFFEKLYFLVFWTTLSVIFLLFL